jgi:hypothetical protein
MTIQLPADVCAEIRAARIDATVCGNRRGIPFQGAARSQPVAEVIGFVQVEQMYRVGRIQAMVRVSGRVRNPGAESCPRLDEENLDGPRSGATHVDRERGTAESASDDGDRGHIATLSTGAGMANGRRNVAARQGMPILACRAGPVPRGFPGLEDRAIIPPRPVPGCVPMHPAPTP